jgi:hypothetical protein
MKFGMLTTAALAAFACVALGCERPVAVDGGVVADTGVVTVDSGAIDAGSAGVGGSDSGAIDGSIAGAGGETAGAGAGTGGSVGDAGPCD